MRFTGGGASLTFPVGGSRNAQRRAGGNSRLSSARRAAGIPLARPRRLAFPRAQGNARGAGGVGPSWQGARRGEEDGGPPAPPPSSYLYALPSPRGAPRLAPLSLSPRRLPALPLLAPAWPTLCEKRGARLRVRCARQSVAARRASAVNARVHRCAGARCVVRAPATPRPRRNEETLGFESWRPQLSRSLGFDAMSPARKLRGAIFQSWRCHVIMR